MPNWEDYLLRMIEEEDLDIVLHWRNSDRIRANMYTDRIITIDEHRAWFKRLKNDEHSLCMIFEKKKHPIGVINFTQIDPVNRTCSWGFYLGEENLPRGTGSIMGILALDYAFERLGMHKICGEAFAFNQASIRYHQKLGFVKEGRFAKHLKKYGNYEEIISFILFKKSWKQRKTALSKQLFKK